MCECVYVHACMFQCVCVHACVFGCVSTDVCVCVYLKTCMFVCVWVRLCVRVCISLHILLTYRITWGTLDSKCPLRSIVSLCSIAAISTWFPTRACLPRVTLHRTTETSQTAGGLVLRVQKKTGHGHLQKHMALVLCNLSLHN